MVSQVRCFQVMTKIDKDCPTLLKKLRSLFCTFAQFTNSCEYDTGFLALIIDTLMNNSDDTIYFKDLDSKFMLVNDTFGHLAGDAAIRYIGGLIMAHTRSSDTAFRYGGDEYALLLQDTDLAAGRELAERPRRVVGSSPLTIDKSRINLTISLGVVCFCDEVSPGELVSKADINLYQAKNKGRNRVC